jgi:hypothetical protein
MLNKLISFSPELAPIPEGAVIDANGQIWNSDPFGNPGDTFLGRQTPISYEQQLQNTQKGLDTSNTLVGQKLNIGWDEKNPTQTIASVSKEANNPGLVITTNTGNKFNYFDNNYLTNGVISDNKQIISPKFVDYYNNGQAIPLNLSKYSDAPAPSINTYQNGYIVPYSSGKDFYNTVDLTQGYSPLQINWSGQNNFGGIGGAQGSQPDATIGGANSNVTGINPDGSLSLTSYTHPEYSSDSNGFFGGINNALSGSWLNENGWMLPIALATYGLGEAALGAGAVGGETVGAGGLAGGGAFTPAAGSGASFVIEPGAAYAAGAGAGGASSTLPSLSWTAPEIGGTAGGSTFGSFTAPALGTETTGIGMTGAIPEGVMVGNGTLGTTMGATYMQAAPGQFAVDALGNAIPASSVGIGGYAPSSGLSLSDLQNANRAKNLAKALTSSSSSKPSTSLLSSPSSTISNLASGLTGNAVNLPGLIRGNVNPFIQAQQQPIQSKTTDPMNLAFLLNGNKYGTNS